MMSKTKHPGGRPRDPRQQKIQIRLNDEEHAAWRAAAETMSLEIATWARSVVNQALAKRPTKGGSR